MDVKGDTDAEIVRLKSALEHLQDEYVTLSICFDKVIKDRDEALPVAWRRMHPSKSHWEYSEVNLTDEDQPLYRRANPEAAQ